MYLLDTNIWLERLLDQEHSDDVARFLNQVPGDRLFITDFSLHSIDTPYTAGPVTGN